MIDENKPKQNLWARLKGRDIRDCSDQELKGFFEEVWVELATRFQWDGVMNALIAEENRRSSNKAFWANFIVSITALIISLFSIFGHK